MLWCEIYKPQSFDKITSHREIVDILETFTLKTVPNLVFHGSEGSNKKTLLYAFLHHLYGNFLKLKKVTQEIQINSTNIDVSYLESDEIIVINPSIYKNRDRLVVQYIIKKFAESKPISGFFKTKGKGIKTIVIEQAENLSRDAQAALRITMEEYSEYLKIFMICTDTSRLIEPIKSRNLFIKCRRFEDKEINTILTKIGEEEHITIDTEAIKGICKNAEGNCKRAIEVFELNSILNSDKTKRNKMDLSAFKLGWEEKLFEIIKLIKQGKVENMMKIRNILYEVFMTNIDPFIIYCKLFKYIISEIEYNHKTICDIALKYSERMTKGNKHIFHIEAFIANIMVLQ